MVLESIILAKDCGVLTATYTLEAIFETLGHWYDDPGHQKKIEEEGHGGQSVLIGELDTALSSTHGPLIRGMDSVSMAANYYPALVSRR